MLVNHDDGIRVMIFPSDAVTPESDTDKYWYVAPETGPTLGTSPNEETVMDACEALPAGVNATRVIATLLLPTTNVSTAPCFTSVNIFLTDVLPLPEEAVVFPPGDDDDEPLATVSVFVDSVVVAVTVKLMSPVEAFRTPSDAVKFTYSVPVKEESALNDTEPFAIVAVILLVPCDEKSTVELSTSKKTVERLNAFDSEEP